MINPAFEKKFIETLTMIRNNDPKLKQISEDLFKEEDFDYDEDKQKEGKLYAYKDQIRDEVLKKSRKTKVAREGSDSEENDEQLFKKRDAQKETVLEEEQRLKKEFKMAAQN